MTPERGTQDLLAICDAHSALSVPFCDRNQFQAVVFDCDAVLVDSRENYRRAYEMVLREAGANVTPREIYLREGQPTPQLLTALLSLRQISVTETQIREMVERRRGRCCRAPRILSGYRRCTPGSSRIRAKAGNGDWFVSEICEPGPDARAGPLV